MGPQPHGVHAVPATASRNNLQLARAVYGLPADFPPLPRLLKAPFHGKPTMELLLQDFKHMKGQPGGPALHCARHIRALASGGSGL